MTSRRILPLAVLLSLAIFPAFAHAQTTRQDETTALREKAFALLESVAGQLGTLQSGENRARLGANIADSLWTHDEKLARSVLHQVEADIRAELQKWQPQAGMEQTLLIFLKLRVETIERIAKHDGEAALAFLKGTELRSEDMPRDAFQKVEGMETRLAQKIADNNPEVALKLGREALKQGFSYELIPLLRRLNKKHKEPAQALYRDVVRKLQNADLLNNWNVRYFARNLAHSFRPPAADPAIYRELISIFVALALKNGCGEKLADDDFRRSFCYWVASEMPDLEKFDSRASQLRHWGRGSDRATDLSVAAELNELLEDGTTEQILAAASKHPEYAPIIYLQLMERARQAGDFEQVRKIADTYITDPEKRKNILAQFGNVEKKAARNQVALAEIEEELAKIPQPFVQAWFLLGEAHKFGDNDRKIALNLLDRASDLIHSIKPGKEQTTAQLGLAVMYCYEKNERCFGIMESLMPRLNELVDVAARLDGYETNYLRDGEWNMSANGAVGELLTRLSETAGAFAWFDFDRAVSLASRFDRAEIRMMAHVKLAQSILAGPLKRLPPFTER